MQNLYQVKDYSSKVYLIPVTILTLYVSYYVLFKMKFLTKLVLFTYRTTRFLLSFFPIRSSGSIGIIQLVQFDYPSQKFTYNGYVNDKLMKFTPEQFTINRSVNILVDGIPMMTLTGVIFQEKNDFDSSTTFVFASNNVQFQKESVISITCNVFNNRC